MTLVLEDREYQNEAVARSLDFLHDRKKKNGIAILPCGSGKSLVAARLALALDAPTILLQPRKELVIQNRDKLRLYGFEPAIFSASLNKREVGEITLATIGSIVKYPEYFEDVRYLIIDECSDLNPAGGEHKKFISKLHPKVRAIGLDATPFRRHSTMSGTELRFLTRQTPRFFNEVVHFTQLQELFEKEYLAKLEYFPMDKEIPSGQMELEFNSNGSDYTDESVQRHLNKVGFAQKLVDVVGRLLVKGRRGILVFTRFTKEAEALAAAIPGVAVVTAKTPPAVRDATLTAFRSGAIKVVSNVSVLGIGFDYPEADTVVLARHTLSLRVFYQEIGRIVRRHPDKESGWVVDMVGNLKTFGRLEHLKLYCKGERGWAFFGRPGGGAEKQLTNVPIGGAPMIPTCKKCKSTEFFYSRNEEPPFANAMLSRPIEGMKPYLVLKPNPKNPTGQKVYNTVSRGGGLPAEFVHHSNVCGKQHKSKVAAAKVNPVDVPAPWDQQQPMLIK